MATISLHGAEQVLRPPEDGLPHLRLDRAGEQRLEPGSLHVRAGRIAGFAADPRAEVQVDAGGGALVPGFVDCLTALPFGGWTGAPAADVTALRQSRELAAEMLREGTTAFEWRAATVDRLRLASRVAPLQTTVATAAVPPDDLPAVVASTRARAYAAPAALAGAAAAHDLWLRVEAEGDVEAAVAGRARAVEGLTGAGPEDVAALAGAPCAAVLLPAAELLTAEHLSPGRALADAGALCAIATGCHPVRAPVTSMPLVIGLAARLHGWSVLEALAACTLNAAWVLGLSEATGSLEVGKRADVLLLDGPAELVAHRLGRNPVAVAICGGEVAWVRPDQAWRVT